MVRCLRNNLRLTTHNEQLTTMAKDKLNIKTLSREQILDMADAAGTKLGFLLATSSLVDEAKLALLSILEYATPEQLDILSEMLENGLIQAHNKEVDEFFKKEVEEIRKEYDTKKTDLDAAVIKDLEALAQKLG